MTSKAKKIRASFALAFLLLPPPQRLAIQTLYRFCRVIDDEIDGGDAQNGIGRDPDSLQKLIASWRHEVKALYHGASPDLSENPRAPFAGRVPGHVPGHVPGPVPGPVPGRAEILALKPFILLYGWPERHLVGLLDGMAFDVAHFGGHGKAGDAAKNPRAVTEQEFADYCQFVAGGIGELVLQTLGVAPPLSQQLATHLGRAMQTTNILRDIAEDAAHHRVYLPQEIWQKFGYAAPDARRVLSHPALNLVTQELARRARHDYDQAFADLAKLKEKHRQMGHRLRGLGFVMLMACLYRDLLHKTQKNSWVKRYFPRLSQIYGRGRKIFWLGRSIGFTLF